MPVSRRAGSPAEQLRPTWPALAFSFSSKRGKMSSRSVFSAMSCDASNMSLARPLLLHRRVPAPMQTCFSAPSRGKSTIFVGAASRAACRPAVPRGAGRVHLDPELEVLRRGPPRVRHEVGEGLRVGEHALEAELLRRASSVSPVRGGVRLLERRPSAPARTITSATSPAAALRSVVAVSCVATMPVDRKAPPPHRTGRRPSARR